MREGNYPRLTLLAGMVLCLVLSGCQLTRGSQAETGTGLRITLGEAYPGVKDGNAILMRANHEVAVHKLDE